MIRFYGSPASSAGRTHWLLEELGIPYEYERIGVRTGLPKPPEFLAANPTGKVPFIEDGDVKLFESIAINFYLAEKYGPSLWSSDLGERGQIYQWSLWAMTNVQPILLDIMYHTALLPEPERDPKQAEKARGWMVPYLKILDGALRGKEYLVAGKFSVADVNAGSVINMAPFLGVPLDSYPSVAAWMARLKARPAYKRAASPE
jgi:glutathione S-transferase